MRGKDGSWLHQTRILFEPFPEYSTLLFVGRLYLFLESVCHASRRDMLSDMLSGTSLRVVSEKVVDDLAGRSGAAGRCAPDVSVHISAPIQ
jgi:hypothetical protein